ncbi:MAG: hypothetical protein UU73_C0005G0027 [Candidatus Daviesbacteria bacterium GW2011_GWA1_41_61]|uniref:Uncharacterized protein n=1 Tax=Candidatus Daviesbacteria bacterium GW2011_GWA2_40_9 TaxID=1618424 RepID=A0A0G0U3L7_9BACT|nr:MAG: hypothetical protein UU29_C0003G0046 [Candidatus Daviesbacteria bacterium GW2011_GWA2_40_9]KKR92697.1 MAG: hypothetical protein UU44_C0005G0027 [Candidatus Daviesbacteria bacterium GW2011_GWB1_41_15]KKS14628.1 MAG: hypothetical protein UU73_C0005G0027 [Candidatus Daviesbacteria bacterium GW2011_GWA1_41_61]
MDRKLSQRCKENLQKELELLSKQPLTDSQAFEAYFNLSGFLKVLNKMKKEAVTYGKV